MKSQNTVTIATWNIAGGHTHTGEKHGYSEAEDLDYFIRHLKDVDADIVCLQESHHSPKRSIAREIAKALGYPYVTEADHHPSHIAPDSDYMLSSAVLSRLPQERVHFLGLPLPDGPAVRPDGTEVERTRKQVIVCDIGGIQVVNLHHQAIHFFGHSFQNEAGRAYAKKLEQKFLLPNLKRPLVMAGDFNMDNVETVHHELITKLRLTDSLAGKQTTCYDHAPDYIFYSPEFTRVQARVDTSTQTDHYLCWTRLEYDS